MTETSAPVMAFALVAAVLAAHLAVPQGVFEDCAPADGEARCAVRLRQIAGGGFTVVIDYSQFYGTAKAELDYARTAQVLGVQIVWNFSEPAFWNGSDLRKHFPDLATDCRCSDNASFIRYAVDLVRRLPATWGYYVGDEAPQRDRHRVRALAHAIAVEDPGHPRLFVGIGDPSLNAMRANIAPFAESAEVLAADYYPVGSGVPVARVEDIADNLRRIAAWTHRKGAIVLQAFDWGQYPDQPPVCSPMPSCARFPTAAEMRAMRNAALASGRPAMIIWYSYFDVARSNDPARHWADLVKAAGIR